MAVFLGCGITGGKVLWDVCVVIKTVHNIEVLGILGGLLGQVGGTAAADDQNVHFILVRSCLVYMINRHFGA